MIKLDNSKEAKNRIESAREWMKEKGTDGLTLLPGDNFFYFTGCRIDSMERLTSLIVTMNSETIICPKLMEEQIRSGCGIQNVITWNDSDDPFILLRELLELNRIKRLAIEGSTPYSTFLKLRNMGVQDIAIADELYSKMRSRKSPKEIKLISIAVSKSETAYSNTIKNLERGISEIEVSEILEQNFKKQGLSSPAFKTIVCFGENAALPHHEPSGRKLKKGDIVLIDFGGAYSGYASDTTRTVAYGALDRKWVKIYETVKKAQENTIESVRKNTRFSEIDSTAREIISETGFGDLFIHRVGHGLGISVHEEPYLVPDNLHTISKGTVFTVEPGIYVYGSGGVRIEDTLFFDGTKAQSFNSLEKDLIIL